MRHDFFDIVLIDGPDAPDEVRGLEGHVCGRGEDGAGIAVFVYALEKVWCMDDADVTPLGRRDEEAAAWSAEASRRLDEKYAALGFEWRDGEWRPAKDAPAS